MFQAFSERDTMIDAYRRTRSLIETPRATESRLMSEVTGELIAARDARLSGIQMMPTLHWNREIWNTFAAACGASGNALAPDLRAAIISIGLWVDRYTSEVVRGQESVDALIDVNRAMIEGLTDRRQAA